MALVLADRVKVYSTSTGLGPFTLGNPLAGFQSFAAVGDGNQTYYIIIDTAQNWEIGLGTYTASSNSLSRDTIISSSYRNLQINFSAGSKNVSVTFPSSLAQANFASGTGLGNMSFYGTTIDTSNGNPITVNKNTTFNNNLTVNGTLNFATLSGNTATATRLQTARTINGVSFDGSANITVPAAGSTLTGTSIASNILTSSLTQTGTVTSGTWSSSFGAVSGANLTNLTAANLTGTIPSAVLGNSNVYIGTTAVALNRQPVAQTLSGVSIGGNAFTATTLQTARTINGVNFDGSGNITVPASSETLTGTILASNVVNSSLTSVGTLTSLTVSGSGSIGTNLTVGTTTAHTLTVTGSVSRQVPMFSRQNSTSQLIGSGSDTRIAFDTAVDSVGATGLTYDGTTQIGRFTNTSGASRVFLVSATVTYSANSAGVRSTSIKKNGVKLCEVRGTGMSGEDTAHNVFVPVLLNSFDYFEVHAYQTTGVNLLTGTGDSFNGNYISVVWA